MSGTAARRLTSARTLLFAPGNRPDRFDKAIAAGPDLVVLDLEDAVPAADKDAARTAVDAWLAGHPGAPVAVRINAAETGEHAADVELASRHDCVVMLAKAEDLDVLEHLSERTGSRQDERLIALVETAAGVLQAAGIARLRGVGRLAFGSFDLAAQLGVDPTDRSAMAASRSALVLGSAAAGIAGPIDGVSAAIDDPDALRAETEAAARLGFTGKLCIHPRQVDTVAAALSPTPDMLAWAQRVVEADAASRAGVVVVDGRMVDRPVVLRARRLLDAAR